jgi:hypothetical protein
MRIPALKSGTLAGKTYQKQRIILSVDYHGTQ